MRELENVLERGVILAPQNGLIEVQHLFIGNVIEPTSQHSLSAQGALEATASHVTPQDLTTAVLESGISLEAFEQSLLQRAVERANGNLSAAARLLGMTRPQLNYRIKKLGE